MSTSSFTTTARGVASSSSSAARELRKASRTDRARGTRRVTVAAAADADAFALAPKTYKTNEIAVVSAAKQPAVATPNKFQEFGRQYWPAFAALEGVALIGATVNGIMSRKRREEIARLNAQMRSIMAKLDAANAANSTAMDSVDDADPAALATLADAKRALASDHNERARELFTQAAELAQTAKDLSTEYSALKGLGMSLAAQRQFQLAADALERAVDVSKRSDDYGVLGDSAAYGLLGEVYTDLGAFDAAAKAYDLCIRAMDE